MSDVLWEVSGLTLSGTPRDRLSDVSCVIESGCTAIVGQSGAGKTSLLNVLTEFEQPGSGTAIFRAGEASRDSARGPRRLGCYWAPQADGLWDHLTAAEHLTTVMARAGDGRPLLQGWKSSDELLAAFDLTERHNAFPGELSRGERSRLAVARALMACPRVLVLDEPLSHVDPARRPTYWHVVAQTARRNGMSLVFSSHNPDDVIREAERAICLHEGRVAFNGSVQQLYNQPPDELAASFLGPFNWFTSDEAQRWLKSTIDKPICLRPEQLQLQRQPDGDLTVVESLFCGSHALTSLRDADAMAERQFAHRPPDASLTADDRIRLQLLVDPASR